jgi:hypothetical protein
MAKICCPRIIIGMSAGPLQNLPRAAIGPQFRLRTLFFVVTLFGVLFGLLHALGPIAFTVFLMVAATIGLHMAGNALGTTRRDESTESFGEAARPVLDEVGVAERCAAVKSSNRLREHAPLGWVIRITTLLGAATGMTAGVFALSHWTDGRLPGLILGATSAGVLGGFFGFLGGSFLEIARRAWWQATCESRRDQARTRHG